MVVLFIVLVVRSVQTDEKRLEIAVEKLQSRKNLVRLSASLHVRATLQKHKFFVSAVCINVTNAWQIIFNDDSKRRS